MRNFIKILLLAIVSFVYTSCNEQGWSEKVPYTIAKGYFTKNVPDKLTKSVIYSKSSFDSMFGVAATNESGASAIDFNESFVIAIMQKPVDIDQTISPYALNYNAGVLQCAYTITNNGNISYKIAPLLLLVVSREYADCEVAFFEM